VAQQAFAGRHKPHHQQFCKTLTSLAGRHQTWRLFADFCELAAMCLSNVVCRSDEREQRYLAVAQTYDKDEMRVMCELLGIVTEGLEADNDRPSCDFLGECFQELELASHWHGQYFTPWHLALALAQLVGPTADHPAIRTRGWITASEPACGAGVMVLALAAAMRDQDLNPHTQLHVTAVDVDATAAYMAFIQFSLWHIPAVVVIGNSLSLEVRHQMWTPAHWLGMWDERMRLTGIIESVEKLLSGDSPALQDETTQPGAASDVRPTTVREIAGDAIDEDAPIAAPRPQMKLF
jgi:hypothetical protein